MLISKVLGAGLPMDLGGTVSWTGSLGGSSNSKLHPRRGFPQGR